MNDKQKEEIREEFNQSVEYLITNEAVIDWWLSKIDSLLTSQRDSFKKAFIKEFFMSGERWYNYGFENEEERNDALKEVEEEFEDLITQSK